MKKHRYILALVAVAALVAAMTGFGNEKVQESAKGNITSHGEHMVVLTGRKDLDHGDEIIIYSMEDGQREIFRKDISFLNPWKIMVGDVDGDGIDEISIGVYKESPLHQVMAKRPFFYNFDGEDLIPKWRGSRLSRPFEDYILHDLDGDGTMEVVSIEYLQDGRQLVNSYKWREFGFEGYKESDAFNNIEGMDSSGGNLFVYVKEGSLSRRIIVYDESDRLKWREYDE